MKFRRLWIVALLFGSILIPAFAAPETGDPAAVVQALYRTSLDHFEGFSPEAIKRVKPWVTPELYVRLQKKAHQPVAKGDAPDIEGDIFLDGEEPPTKFEVGKSSINNSKATVDLTAVWPGEKRQYTVLLEQVNGAWKVYDVNYGKDGKLTDLLRILSVGSCRPPGDGQLGSWRSQSAAGTAAATTERTRVPPRF